MDAVQRAIREAKNAGWKPTERSVFLDPQFWRALSRARGWDADERACVFRPKPATDSDANRPLIPTEAGHPFRSKPATLWRVVEALSCSATESPDQTLFAAMQGEVRCPPRERRCGRFAKS
jgi:hypothetical protein